MLRPSLAQKHNKLFLNVSSKGHLGEKEAGVFYKSLPFLTFLKKKEIFFEEEITMFLLPILLNNILQIKFELLLE